MFQFVTSGCNLAFKHNSSCIKKQILKYKDEAVDCIHVALDIYHWQAIPSTVMNFNVPQNVTK